MKVLPSSFPQRLSFPSNDALIRILAVLLALQSVVFNGITQAHDETLLVLIVWWGAYLALDHACLDDRLRPTPSGMSVGALLVLCHQVMPFEVVGVIATGLPLMFALWRLDPPHDQAAWRRAAQRLGPYALLTVALLAARAVPNPPAWKPFAELPAFPITHVSLVLLAVALMLLARRAGAMVLAQGALKRAARPALIMLLYVLLARWMGESGATASLAREAAAALGPLAPYAVPPLVLIAGMVTGTNVGSNAAVMPVQYKLGLAAGLLRARLLHRAMSPLRWTRSFGTMRRGSLPVRCR